MQLDINPAVHLLRLFEHLGRFFGLSGIFLVKCVECV